MDHLRCRDMMPISRDQLFHHLLVPHRCLGIFLEITSTSTAAVHSRTSMTRTRFTGWTFCHVACLSLMLSHCHCIFYTPYQYLPLTSFDSSNGTFGFPSGETQIFDEGTDMTIRWSTDFAAVNLYVVYNASADPPSMGVQKQLSSEHSRLICQPNHLANLEQSWLFQENTRLDHNLRARL